MLSGFLGREKQVCSAEAPRSLDGGEGAAGDRIANTARKGYMKAYW